MPGGASGCWRATTMERKPTGEVYRIDPGVVSLVAGCGDERQAAEEF
jgi:hypothetical protein